MAARVSKNVELFSYLFEPYKSKGGYGCLVYKHGALCTMLSSNFCETEQQALAEAVWKTASLPTNTARGNN